MKKKIKGRVLEIVYETLIFINRHEFNFNSIFKVSIFLLVILYLEFKK
jgi:hypothetical protein